jgi:hypothetical protein
MKRSIRIANSSGFYEERFEATRDEGLPLAIRRFGQPNLAALNFAIMGLLGGVRLGNATGFPSQGLGKFVRFGDIDTPQQLLARAEDARCPPMVRELSTSVPGCGSALTLPATPARRSHPTSGS